MEKSIYIKKDFVKPLLQPVFLFNDFDMNYPYKKHQLCNSERKILLI